MWESIGQYERSSTAYLQGTHKNTYTYTDADKSQKQPASGDWNEICVIFQIGDLGLSKVKQHTLVSGGVRGTLPWMAPELLSGKSNMVSEKVFLG